MGRGSQRPTGELLPSGAPLEVTGVNQARRRMGRGLVLTTGELDDLLRLKCLNLGDEAVMHYRQTHTQGIQNATLVDRPKRIHGS